MNVRFSHGLLGKIALNCTEVLDINLSVDHFLFLEFVLDMVRTGHVFLHNITSGQAWCQIHSLVSA